MKKNLLLAILALTFTACSSDDNEEINISFSENNISIPVGDEYDISINGVNIKDCKIYSEDEFIAGVTTYTGKVNIISNHTGSTKIIAEYKNKKAECNITITSLINYIGNPILEFGMTKSEIKAKLKGEIIQETTDRLQIKEDFNYSIYATYHFNNDELECVYSEVNVNTSFINISNSLRERYDFISSESNVNWYSYPNKFIIRENARGGNGGYAIRYAKTKEIMGKYYNLN